MPALFSLATLVFVLAAAAGGSTQVDRAALVIALLGTLLLEARAARLPQLGFASLAPAWVMACALNPNLGTLAALLPLATLVGVRVVRSRREPALILREVLIDAFPSAAVVAAALLFEPASRPYQGSLAAIFIWAVASVFLVPLLAPSESSEFGRVRNEMLGLLAGLGLWAAALAHLGQVQLLLPLLLLAPMLSVQRLSQTTSEQPLPSQFRQTRHSLKQALDSKQALQEGLSQAQQTGAATSAALQLLRQTSSRLHQAENLTYLGESLLQLAQEVVDCRSVAVFLPRDDGLAALACHSPDRERAVSTGLLHLEEPILQQVLQQQRPIYQDGPGSPQSIFSGDQARAGLPLGRGVLYVGLQPGASLSRQQRERLELLVEHSSGLLETALAREAQASARASAEAALVRLEAWADRLSSLLNGARMLAGELDRQVVVERIGEIVEALLPRESCCLYLGDGSALTPAGYWGRQCDAEATLVLARQVADNRRPLVFERLNSSRFEPMFSGQQAFLGVPCESQHGTAGVLLLGSSQAGIYARQEQELLYLVGLLGAVALHGAQTHQQLKESQAQLVQAGKMAAVGQLAAGVAHELNTPLGAVMLQLDAATLNLQKARYDKAAQKLASAEKAATTANEIVAKLLFYSREARQGTREVAPSEVIGDTLELLGSQLAIDGIQVVCDLPELPKVMANQNELQQVITNLLVNARDAVKMQGASALRVEVTGSADEQGVSLRVRDYGPGIPVEVQDKLFDPFFTTKPVGQGTGLGLSVSKQIIEQHGGTLSCANLESGGCYFQVRLPLAKSG